MKKKNISYRKILVLCSLFLQFRDSIGHASSQPFELSRTQLSLRDAERKALVTSHQIKASEATSDAAKDYTDAQFQLLLPQLTFQANYQYFGTIPDVSFGNGPTIPFGTNSTYSIGPMLNYTLWDNFSSKRLYESAARLADARREDYQFSQIQVLYALRSSYIRVQLAKEELKLTQNTLELARTQDRNVTARFKAGAASQLDLVIAHRAVLNYEIQREQKQAELSSALEDLLTWVGDKENPADENSVSQRRDRQETGTKESHLKEPSLEEERNEAQSAFLEIQLDPMFVEGEESDTWELSAFAEEVHPQLQSQKFQAEALELAAASQKSKQLPRLALSAGISYLRPNIPNPPSFTQQTVAVTLSLPLFLGDPSSHLASEKMAQAQSIYQRYAQNRVNLIRDFSKAVSVLRSLRVQRKLAERDSSQSEEVARLQYASYQAGKIQLTEVQNANLGALGAKVRAARIDAQILEQRALLKALSGMRFPGESSEVSQKQRES